MDAETYPAPAVAGLIAEHFVAVKLLLGRREDQARFRAHRVIWTPTLAVLDRRGEEHYQAPGYLPLKRKPDELLEIHVVQIAARSYHTMIADQS